jgi:hypothetical protein
VFIHGSNWAVEAQESAFYTQLNVGLTDLLPVLGMPNHCIRVRLTNNGIQETDAQSPREERMKAVMLLILVFFTTGCATLGTVPGTQGNRESSAEDATTSAPATIAPPFQDQNIGPRLIIPATGGAPVIGIPLGGNIFLPVTGGPPIIGIPTSP